MFLNVLFVNLIGLTIPIFYELCICSTHAVGWEENRELMHKLKQGHMLL